jgi:hypothetical protein
MSRSCPMRGLRLIGLCLCALLLAVWGCGGGSGSDQLVPVSGKVTMGGKALSRGSISFRADKLRGNTSSAEPYGQITEDGTYTLYTNKRPGAPVGKYAVLIEASEDVDPNKPSAAPKAIVDPKYSDPDRPIFQVDVVEKPQPGQYNFDVPKPGSVK